MPVKKDRAIEANPALATATTGLWLMNVAATSTCRASIKRTTAIGREASGPVIRR